MALPSPVSMLSPVAMLSGRHPAQRAIAVAISSLGGATDPAGDSVARTELDRKATCDADGLVPSLCVICDSHLVGKARVRTAAIVKIEEKSDRAARVRTAVRGAQLD